MASIRLLRRAMPTGHHAPVVDGNPWLAVWRHGTGQPIDPAADPAAQTDFEAKVGARAVFPDPAVSSAFTVATDPDDILSDIREKRVVSARAFFAIIESRKSAIALRTHTNFVHGCFRWHANSSKRHQRISSRSIQTLSGGRWKRRLGWHPRSIDTIASRLAIFRGA